MRERESSLGLQDCSRQLRERRTFPTFRAGVHWSWRMSKHTTPCGMGGGREEGGREGGRREGEREGRREGEREGGKERGSQRGEEGKEEGRKGGREGKHGRSRENMAEECHQAGYLTVDIAVVYPSFEKNLGGEGGEVGKEGKVMKMRRYVKR